jgi:hypothetical protein
MKASKKNKKLFLYVLHASTECLLFKSGIVHVKYAWAFFHKLSLKNRQPDLMSAGTMSVIFMIFVWKKDIPCVIFSPFFLFSDFMSEKNDTMSADIKSFFQTDLKSTDAVSFLINQHKVRKK